MILIPPSCPVFPCLRDDALLQEENKAMNTLSRQHGSADRTLQRMRPVLDQCCRLI